MSDRFDSFDVSYIQSRREAAEAAEMAEDEEIRLEFERRKAAKRAEQAAVQDAERQQGAEQDATQQLQAQQEATNDPAQQDGSFVGDVVSGFVNGIRDAGVSAGQFGLDMANFGAPSPVQLDEIVPDVEERDSATFQVTTGLTQFATGFVPALGVMSGLGKIATVSKAIQGARGLKFGRAFTGQFARDTAAGAIADFLVFDPHSARFSDFVNSMGWDNPITEFLAADEEDSAVVGRMKNVIEGAGLGAAFDVILKGIRAGKNNLNAFHSTMGRDINPLTAHEVKNVHEGVVVSTQRLDEVDRALKLMDEASAPATDPAVDAARTLSKERAARQADPSNFRTALRDPETNLVYSTDGTHGDLLRELEDGLHGPEGQQAAARISALGESGVDPSGFQDTAGNFLSRREAHDILGIGGKELSSEEVRAAQGHLDAADLRAGQAGIDPESALDEVGAPFDQAARDASPIEQARVAGPDKVMKAEQTVRETRERLMQERAAAKQDLAEAIDALYAMRSTGDYLNLPADVRAEWEKIDEYLPTSPEARAEAATSARASAEAHAQPDDVDAAVRADDSAQVEDSINPNRDESLDEFDQDAFEVYDVDPRTGDVTINQERLMKYKTELNKDGSVRKINIGKQIDTADPVIFRAISAIFARARGDITRLDAKSIGQLRALNNFNTKRMTGPGAFQQMADELATFVRQHLGLASDTIDNKTTLAQADAMARVDAAELGDPDRSARLLQNYRKAFKNKAEDLRVATTVIRIMAESARLEAHRLVGAVIHDGGHLISQAELILAFDNFVQLQNIRDGFAAEIGRALQSFNIKVHAVPVLSAKDAAKIVDGSGGVEAVQNLARQMEGVLDNPAGLEKMVKEVRNVGPGKVFLEYWLNAILSGPITQAVNLFSNSVVMLWAPAEKMLTGSALKVLKGDDLGLINQAVREYQGLAEGWRAAFRLSAEGRKAVWGSLTDQALGRPNATLKARIMMAEAGDEVGNVWKSAAGDEPQMIPGSRQYDFDEENAITASNFKRWGENKPVFRTLVKDMGDDTLGGRLIDWVGNVTRLPGRMLTTGDELAKTLNYHMSLNRLAYDQAISAGAENVDMYVKELVQNVPKHRTFTDLDAQMRTLYEDLDEQAAAYARKFTFTEPLAPGTVGRSVQNFVTQHPTARFVVPFVRTPTNLLHFAGERSPLLWKRSKAYKAAFEAQGSAFKDTAEYAAMRGRMMIGTGLYVTAGMAAYNGILTGAGPTDPQERAALLATGWQPNSIRIQEGEQTRYISFNRTDPFGLFLGMAATFAEGVGQMGDQDIIDVSTSMMLALSETLQSKAYFSGITSVVAALDNPDRHLEAALKQYAGSLVPNFLGSMNRTGVPFSDIGPVGLPKDDMMREAEGVLDAIMAKLPGYSTDLPPRRNIFGEPITYAMGYGPDTFSPFMTRTSSEDPVNQEIQRMVAHGLGLSMNGYKTISGVELDPHMRDRWIQLATGDPSRNGSDLRAGLAKLFQSARYRNADDSEDGKQKIIKDFISKRRQRGQQVLLRENPELAAQIRLQKRSARAARNAKQAAAEQPTDISGMMSSILGSNS